MYREERWTHGEACTASITTRLGALESPFAELSNAPSTVINEPLVGQIAGVLVRIGRMGVPDKDVSTHLRCTPHVVLCNFQSPGMLAMRRFESFCVVRKSREVSEEPGERKESKGWCKRRLTGQ